MCELSAGMKEKESALAGRILLYTCQVTAITGECLTPISYGWGKIDAVDQTRRHKTSGQHGYR